MWMMASRVGEVDEEWSRLRKEVMKRKGEGVPSADGVVMGGKGTNWTRVDPPAVMLKRKVATGTGSGMAEEDLDVKTAEGQGQDNKDKDKGKKRKTADVDADADVEVEDASGGGGIVGVYEPHSNLILCKWFVSPTYPRRNEVTKKTPRTDGADTQPTCAKWEHIPNPKRRVLGGTKAGNGAWGLAWVDTVMQLPEEDEEAQRKRLEEQRQRETCVREAEEMFGQRGPSVVPGVGGGTGRGGSVMPRERDVGEMSLSTRGMSIGV
jgi:chromatin structure-remodeling complex protein RSC7